MIEARRFAQYSANPRRSLSLQWPIRLPLGAQVPRDLLQHYLFWILVKCALEEPWLTTLACQCRKGVLPLIEELRLLNQGE